MRAFAAATKRLAKNFAKLEKLTFGLGMENPFLMRIHRVSDQYRHRYGNSGERSRVVLAIFEFYLLLLFPIQQTVTQPNTIFHPELA